MGRCIFCGKDIKERGTIKKLYCSEKCRADFEAANNIDETAVIEDKPPIYKFECVVCGRTFKTEHSSELCCSKKCKEKYKSYTLHSALNSDCKAAKEMHLTYGEYQTRKYWEKEGPAFRAMVKEKCAEYEFEKRKKLRRRKKNKKKGE